ncbi:type IV secretion protein Rhs [Pilimelia anulata]|uniref:Type IV secretion protein Rhs n=1 Tax=Pilimelia anulata TaxID=53371 RepID=A0A8J3BCM7_9ACTN|nr:VgrG-related protein [Pilimelia anulata]GGK10024.1 type IV secretion protein Rhs [Pilimelia anulata]
MGEGNRTNLLVVAAPAPLPPAIGEQLAHASIEDSAHLPAAATLRYRDQRARVLERTGITIGTVLTVGVRPGDSPAVVPLFAGEVVTVETEFDGAGTFTTIRALDRSHRLMRGRRVRSFRNRTAADIAREVAAGAGLGIGTVDPTRTVYEMVTQPNVTDWEFLGMLAVDNDAEVRMVDGRFCFRRTVRAAGAPGAGSTAERSPYVVQMDENLLALRSTVTSVGQQTAVQVRGWDVRRRQPLTARQPVRPSEGAQLGLDPARAAAPFGAAELLVADVPYRTQAEVGAVAAAVAAGVAGGLAELEVGIRGNPRLVAGVPVALTDVGKPFEGKYTVTASRHVFGPGRFYETWLTVSGEQERSLHGLVTGATAPARAARVPGVAVGIVTDTQAGSDPAHPEHRDRGLVKLRFPWLSDTYESDWVRTVQPGGAGVISPEVDDEVLVGFEQGLLDRPYVLGSLYNGVDRPAPHDGPLVDPRTGAVNRRSLASRPKRGVPAGNWVELLDGPAGAPQGVRLRTRRGGEELLVHLDRGGTSVIVRSDGSVVVEAGTDVSVTARSGGVSVEAAGPVAVRGRGIDLDAGAGALTLSGGSVRLAGAGEVAVTGTIVRIN